MTPKTQVTSTWMTINQDYHESRSYLLIFQFQWKRVFGNDFKWRRREVYQTHRNCFVFEFDEWALDAESMFLLLRFHRRLSWTVVVDDVERCLRMTPWRKPWEPPVRREWDATRCRHSLPHRRFRGSRCSARYERSPPLAPSARSKGLWESGEEAELLCISGLSVVWMNPWNNRRQSDVSTYLLSSKIHPHTWSGFVVEFVDIGAVPE